MKPELISLRNNSSSLPLPLASSTYFHSPSSAQSSFLFLFPSPTFPSPRPPHPSTAVALVTIQRDFLCSSVTVATLGFPPGRCWKRAALRSAPAGSYWPLSNRSYASDWICGSADASVEMQISEDGGSVAVKLMEIQCVDCVNRSTRGLFQSCYQTVWTGEDLLSSRIISWVCFTLVLVHLHQESHSFSTDDKHS